MQEKHLTKSNTPSLKKHPEETKNIRSRSDIIKAIHGKPVAGIILNAGNSISQCFCYRDSNSIYDGFTLTA